MHMFQHVSTFSRIWTRSAKKDPIPIFGIHWCQICGQSVRQNRHYGIASWPEFLTVVLVLVDKPAAPCVTTVTFYVWLVGRGGSGSWDSVGLSAHRSRHISSVIVVYRCCAVAVLDGLTKNSIKQQRADWVEKSRGKQIRD